MTRKISFLYVNFSFFKPFAALASSLELTQRKQKLELSIVIYTLPTLAHRARVSYLTREEEIG